MKTVHTIFFKTLIYLVALVALVIGILYTFIFLPAQEQQLQKQVYEKAKIIFDLSQPVMIKALRSKDDLALLSQVEKVMKISDVTTVYILDRARRVITHDQTGEWGKTYEDELSKKIVTAQKSSVFESETSKGYLFSTPLASSATLVVGISEEKNNIRKAMLVKNAFFGGLTLLFLSAIVLFLVLTIQIKKPFHSFEGQLNSILAGSSETIPANEGGELGDMSFQINEIIGRLRAEQEKGLARARDTRQNDLLIIQELSKRIETCIIVTDAENRVVYFSRKACAPLQLPQQEYQGKHILEILTLPAHIDFLKKSAENLNQVVEQSIGDKKIRAITIANKKGEIVGAIISGE